MINRDHIFRGVCVQGFALLLGMCGFCGFQGVVVELFPVVIVLILLSIGLCSTLRVAGQINWSGCWPRRGNANLLGLSKVLRASKELFWNSIFWQLLHALFIQRDVCVNRTHLASRANEGCVVRSIHCQYLRFGHLFNAMSEQNNESFLQLRRRWRQRCRQVF